MTGAVLRYDLAVVGAGPAGAAAAVTAARAGLSVALIDKAAFPRDKCCGDGLTTLALRELEALGFDPTSVPSWQPVTSARLRAPSGRSAELALPVDEGVHCVVARRRELDAALVAMAGDAGANLHTASAVVRARRLLSGVELGLADDTSLRATHAIAADGAWSPMRKLLDLGPASYRGDLHALRQYLRTGGSTPEGDPAAGSAGSAVLEIFFEPDLLPGYAWAFPLADGTVNAGYGVLRGGTTRLNTLAARWPELLARPHVAACLPRSTADGPVRTWPIPARLGGVPLGDGNVLFVGDAAAATDALTGEGIGQALWTGRRAAEAVATHAGRRAPEALHRYRSDVTRGLAADHRFARQLGSLLASRPIVEVALAAAGCNNWTRTNFARWLFEAYPRALLATPRRWGRGAMAEAGAFAGEARR